MNILIFNEAEGQWGRGKVLGLLRGAGEAHEPLGAAAGVVQPPVRRVLGAGTPTMKKKRREIKRWKSPSTKKPEKQMVK